MEQAQYWMWMKKRQFLKTNFQVWKNNPINDSWEEKAFAEDASGSLGGCIWPPRSYSCSFCKREFRSAQALGGHMNVHRRDRARLKQSLSSPQNNDQNFHYQNNHNQNPLKSSFDFHLDYINLDPNSSTLTSSRVSALSNQENLSDSTFVSPPSSIIQEKPNKVSTSLTRDHHGFVETDLFMGFNSVATQNQLITDSCGDISFKRPKTAISALSFLIKPCSNDRYSLQTEVIEDKSSSMEDIDLELRLGEPPKVK